MALVQGSHRRHEPDRFSSFHQLGSPFPQSSDRGEDRERRRRERSHLYQGRFVQGRLCERKEQLALEVERDETRKFFSKSSLGKARLPLIWLAGLMHFILAPCMLIR